MNIFKKLNLNIIYMDRLLDPINNLDIIKREITIAGREACIYYIDGFLKDQLLQQTMDYFLQVSAEKMKSIKTADDFNKLFMTYPEVDPQNDFDEIIKYVLSGSVALFIDKIEESIIIDTREYPARSITEPEKDKVLRGSKDGFIETPMVNIALIRRRIRNKELCVEYMNMGEETNNDVVLCYMNNKVDKKTLEIIKNRLNEIKPKALVMGSQSLAEAMVNKKWYNPFPKFRFSDRPDIIASNILEGRIILIVDNTPSAIILPTYLTDFFEEAGDYYFSPTVSSYLKLNRILIFLVTMLLTPIWFLLVKNIDFLPEWLSFLRIKEMNSIPLIIQLLLLEFAIEIIKTASINTPSMISSSIGLIGTIILGDIVVTTKFIIPEAILVTAIATLGYYSQPSYELGYAVKLVRVVMLILIGIFNIYGFIAGLILLIILISTNKTVTKQSYMYPIIPFNAHDFSKIFVRNKNN